MWHVVLLPMVRVLEFCCLALAEQQQVGPWLALSTQAFVTAFSEPIAALRLSLPDLILTLNCSFSAGLSLPHIVCPLPCCFQFVLKTHITVGSLLLFILVSAFTASRKEFAAARTAS